MNQLTLTSVISSLCTLEGAWPLALQSVKWPRKEVEMDTSYYNVSWKGFKLFVLRSLETFFFIKGSFDHPWTSVTLPTYPTRGAHEKLFHFIPMAVRHFSSADVDGPTELQSGSGCVQSVGALAASSEDSEGIWQIGVQGFTGWLTASFFGFPRA